MPLRDNLWRDTVARLDAKKPVCMKGATTIAQAVSAMQTNHCGCLFVEEGGRLAGVFTERDLLKRVLAAGADTNAPIETVMTADPAQASSDDAIGSLLQKIRDGGFRHIPVVDAVGHVTGWVSVREIIHYMVEHFPKAVYNLPPEPNQVMAAPDGA